MDKWGSSLRSEMAMNLFHPKWKPFLRRKNHQNTITTTTTTDDGDNDDNANGNIENIVM